MKPIHSCSVLTFLDLSATYNMASGSFSELSLTLASGSVLLVILLLHRTFVLLWYSQNRYSLEPGSPLFFGWIFLYNNLTHFHDFIFFIASWLPWASESYLIIDLNIFPYCLSSESSMRWPHLSFHSTHYRCGTSSLPGHHLTTGYLGLSRVLWVTWDSTKWFVYLSTWGKSEKGQTKSEEPTVVTPAEQWLGEVPEAIEEIPLLKIDEKNSLHNLWAQGWIVIT